MSVRVIFHIRGVSSRHSHEMVLEESAVVRVGRVEENHIAIRDQGVSRYHLQLQYRDHVLIVTDLNSKHGTFFQGSRLEGPTVLKPGEILNLGDTELFFEILGEERLPAAPLKETPVLAQDSLAIRDALHFYLEQDLSPFQRRREVKPPDHMVRILLRTLFVP